MTVFEELKRRGLIAQMTDEAEIAELINNGKATFYIGYPEKDDRNFNKYVNSRLENGEIKIIIRDLVTGGEKYEHSN